MLPPVIYSNEQDLRRSNHAQRSSVPGHADGQSMADTGPSSTFSTHRSFVEQFLHEIDKHERDRPYACHDAIVPVAFRETSGFRAFQVPFLFLIQLYNPDVIQVLLTSIQIGKFPASPYLIQICNPDTVHILIIVPEYVTTTPSRYF